jgi:tRNA A37 N6-isopentenylltransferase MiaA
MATVADPSPERRNFEREAIAGAVMDTRRYAKRQLTWFRNQMKDWMWADPNDALSGIRSHFQPRV